VAVVKLDELSLDLARSPLTLSVVICAYTLRRRVEILASVYSVQHQSTCPREIILVCDHNAELLEWAHQEFAGVRVLANSSTQGLSGARNTGVQAASGDIVAFLDDDAVAAPDWVDELLMAYRDSDVIGVGGTVVPLWHVAQPRWFPDEFLWVVGCSYEGQPKSRAQVRNAIGANMSFRRDTFAAVGGFDVGVGRIGRDAAGCEETEFSIRARQARPGAKIILEPAAVCRHSVTADRVTRRYFRRRCQAEGRSKAVVSGLAGADSALEAERIYVRRVLPLGVLRGLGDLLRGDVTGAARAWAIVEGLLVTATSYLTTRVVLRTRLRRGPPGTVPPRGP